MNPSIQTAHGTKLFDLADPQARDVDINDIAHSLSLICRFTGHTKKHYSVAQHSYLAYLYMMSTLNASPLDCLYALLHDAHEAYTGDISQPMGKFFPSLYELKDRIQLVIYRAFGLALSPTVRTLMVIRGIDERLLFTEKRDFFTQDVDWGWTVNPYPARIRPWRPALARKRFLEVFDRLKRGEWGGIA